MTENKVQASPDQAEKKARQEAAARKRKRKLLRKRLITLAVVLLVCGGIAFGLYELLREEEPELTVWSDFVSRGSITSTVTGSGTTKALNTATLTLTSGGEVREVFVAAGDQVEKGDPLYNVDSSEAEKAVENAKEKVRTARKGIEEAEKSITDAEKNLANQQKRLAEHQKSYGNLTFTAPFAGKLLLPDTWKELQAGDEISAGQSLGTLVDDKTMKLSLYFSYAYESSFYTGQGVTVSIPAAMQTLQGTVKEINKVRRITPEGSALFEVLLSVPNPGVLTAGMGATAALTGPAGEEILPYEPGLLQYSRSQELATKAGGELVMVNLRNYADVSAGQTLVQMKDDKLRETQESIEADISSAQDSLNRTKENLETAEKTKREAEEDVAKAEKALESYHAFAPISGSVISCNLTPGESAEANRVAVTIADTSVMLVDIRIDSMNIAYVEPGMPCDLTMWGNAGEQYFFGTVDSVSMEGKSENGYSYFPATVRVDNEDGSMKPGMSVDYSMVASQSDDCLLVPNQAVKQSALGTCVFIRSDVPPENALDPAELGLEVPEGFCAVPVMVGLSDQTSAEISQGVEEGQEVFVQYMTNEGSSYGGGIGMMVG